MSKHRRNKRSIPRLDPIGNVDFEALRRIDAFVAQAREEMGEERWAELNAGWSADEAKGEG